MPSLANAELTPLASGGQILNALTAGIHGDIVLASTGGKYEVLKVVQAPKDGQSPNLRPHNIAREAALLTTLRHPNIVEGFAHTFDGSRFEHVLKMEALAVTMSDVLTKCYPHPEAAFDTFQVFAKGIFSALAFLHARGISHRDIKPANVMLDTKGEPKLIDFGTAWDKSYKDGDGEGEMTNSVGTGPYRAPELLFSPRLYDAPAIDLWSAGVALAEFFRPAKPDTDSDSDEDEFHDAEMDPLDDSSPPSPAPLFDASFGEIGLAASIFKRLGTPTAKSWPTFSSLPDAAKMVFESREPKLLATALNLDALDASQRSTVLTLLESVIRLEPSFRIAPAIPPNTAPLPSFCTPSLNIYNNRI